MVRHSDNSNEVDSTTDKLQRRRFMKHMVEKRRRNRINDCLENMRTLVLKAQNKNPENYTKMEKADILEMTTNFLSLLNQQKEATNHVTPTHPAINKYDQSQPIGYGQPMPVHEARDYSHGYSTCQTEINNYLNNYRMRDQSRATSPMYGFKDQYNTLNSYGCQYPTSTTTSVVDNIDNTAFIKAPSHDGKISPTMQQLTAKRALNMDFKVINNNCTVSSSDANVWRPW